MSYKFTLWNGKEIETTELRSKFAYHKVFGNKNGTQAYIEANPTCQLSTARNEAYLLQQKEDVKLMIKHHQIQQANEYKDEYKELLNHLYEESKVRIEDTRDENGKLLRFEEMSRHVQSALKVKYKSPKMTKTDGGMFSQPTLFGNAEDVEIEWDNDAPKKAREQFIQLTMPANEIEEE